MTPRMELLWCDGTWAPRGGSSASEALRRALDPTRVGFVYVPYPAEFGPATGPSDLAYAESVWAGVEAMGAARERVDDGRTRVAVGGYSQGAAVAVAYARLVRSESNALVACATMGDPHHPVVGGRSGIAEALKTPCQRLTVRAAVDPIADLPLGSPLRSVADLGAWMSIRDWSAALRWGNEMAADVADLRRMQRWWRNPAAWAGLTSAGHYAANYLGTNHTTDYARKGHAVRLARQIEAVA